MSTVKAPRSLRTRVLVETIGEPSSSHTVTVACLMAVGSIGAAEAQTPSTLPAVTVDAPVVRPRPPAAKPSAEQIRARNALRRIARRPAQQQAVPAPGPSPAESTRAAPDADPYADPAAPYKGDRLASTKFTQPLIDTPKSVTVLTKELLEDKNATTLKEAARTTAGVTLGTGEGGNAFGDRFFIRGFDARNDIFLDGVRDPGVSIRENFFTEQIEILRGPASSFAGRGTTGGAINIVTKQARERSFYNADATLGTDATKRVTVDVNQAISPTLSVRTNVMGQTAGVAERDYVFDDRWGALGAVRWAPTERVVVTANYIHTDLDMLPDFGVPYNRRANAPFTETGVPRDTWYGFVKRDFQKVQQDIGTGNVAVALTDDLTFNNRTRVQRSVLNYIGTLPQAPDPVRFTYTASPQSRYQVTEVGANQSDFTLNGWTGPIKHTVVLGTEFAHEQTSIDSYTGLSSEAFGPGAFTGNGALPNQSVFAPPNLLPFPNFNPRLTGNPTIVPVETRSGYVIETANFQDLLLVNGGIRFDDYQVSAYKALTPNRVVAAHTGMANWNAGVVAKPLPWASLYAAYATSSNPVGAEVDGSSANYGGLNPTSPINQIFGPQKNRAAEVGTKWELFDRHLLVTGALFRTEATNAREVIPAGRPNAGQIAAGARYLVEGIDLGAAGRINERWSLFGGLVLMRTEVVDSIVPSNIGLPLANIANQSFNVLSKYKVTDELELGAQATWRSRIYGGSLLAANQGTVLPSYWRFDAFAEYKLSKNIEAKLFVNNIFNELYYDAFYQSASPFVFVAPGRSATLVMSARF